MRARPTREQVRKALRDVALLWKPPPDKQGADSTGGKPVGPQEAHNRGHQDHSDGAPLLQGRCACCRGAIDRASPALLGAHAACWHAAGERIRRVSRAAIEQQQQADIAAWRDEYQRTELELQAEGWL